MWNLLKRGFCALRDLYCWRDDGPVLQCLDRLGWRSEKYILKNSGVEPHLVYRVLFRLHERGYVQRTVDEMENSQRPMYREAIYKYRLTKHGFAYVGFQDWEKVVASHESIE